MTNERELGEGTPRRRRAWGVVVALAVIGLFLAARRPRPTGVAIELAPAPSARSNVPQAASSPSLSGRGLLSGPSARVIATQGRVAAEPPVVRSTAASKARGLAPSNAVHVPPSQHVLPYFGASPPGSIPKRSYETFAPPPNTRPMLMVFTAPPGVPIEVDGHLEGVTPLLRPVAPRTESVRVRLYGAAYKERVETLKAGPDGNFQLATRLELKNPRPGVGESAP